MKKVLLLIALSLNAFSISFEISWSNDFEKRTRIACNFEKRCFKYFGGIYSAPEEFCADCLSTSIKMDFIFKGIGSYIVAGDKLYSEYFFKELSDGNLISMNYMTPYNLIDSTSKLRSRMKFSRLCPDKEGDPTIFFDRNDYNEIGAPRFILCGGEVFKADILEVELDTQLF